MQNQEKILISKLRRKGLGYKKIATELDLPLNTVKSYCRCIHETEKISAQNVCLMCGESVIRTPGKREKKFCSDECRMKWWKEHSDLIERKAPYELTCLYCRKTFNSRIPRRKYCSRECYASARKEANRSHD